MCSILCDLARAYKPDSVPSPQERRGIIIYLVPTLLPESSVFPDLHRDTNLHRAGFAELRLSPADSNCSLISHVSEY
jgi:hypothetical protein